MPTTPRTYGSPGFSFHLRDTELLVTAFPGCRTRFFLPITTCHATTSRILLIPPFSLRSSRSIPLPRPYDRSSASGWSPLFFSLPLSFSHAPWSRAQSPISNDRARRSPEVDPTATHERSRSVQSRGSVHEGVRTAPFLLLLYTDLFTSSTVSESKAMDYTRECILHRREGGRTNFQYLAHFPPFQRSTGISQKARITL